MKTKKLFINIDHKKLTKNAFSEFLTPKKIFIPVTHNNKPLSVLVKKGDSVKIGTAIAENFAPFYTKTHASISGTVVDDAFLIKTIDNKYVKSLVIENDFKEEKTFLDRLVDPTKEKILERMKDAGLVGLGGSGFPTWVKYTHKEPIETLVINAAECEPYLTVDYFLLMNNPKEIVEGIKLALTALAAKNAVIVVKNIYKTKVLNLYENLIGEKITFKFLPNRYPVGWERDIIKRVFKKSYQFLPKEKGFIVSNLGTIFSLFEACEYGKPLVEKIITLSGNGFVKQTNLKVKIGTSFEEICENFPLVNDKALSLTAGGPMTGSMMTDTNFLVAKNLSGVIALTTKEIELKACLKCGKCVDTCPMKLSPVIISDAYKTKNHDLLKALKPNLCMECGLCSYVCPSRIEITNEVKMAKNYLAKIKALEEKNGK